MNKKLATVLVIIALVLGLAVAGAAGYLWYQNNHIFVEEDAYPIDSQSLDLREMDISFAYYNSLHAQLPNCEILWNVPFQDGKFSNASTSLSVADLTESDIAVLRNYFPALKKIDASACQNYAMLESLKAQMPELEVIYTVSLGGKSFGPDTTELVLENGDYDPDTLMTNLPHLPQVTAITLKKTGLSLEQIEGLKAAYENIAIGFTVEILGVEYDGETTELDLSALTSENVEETCEKLTMLPKLTAVELMDAQSTSALTMEDVKALMTAAPNAAFHYVFDFYGVTLSTTDEAVHIKNKKIGDEGEAQVRLALDLMPNCKRFVLEYCRLSNEVLAQIREDYRDQTKVVWRVSFGKGSTLTDVEVIRCTYDLLDDNCHDLIYCEDVRYMDIGHNEFLDAVPFVAGMPNLEVIIVSGAPIKDLTPFANCKKLRILEIAYCSYISDLSPLAGCESLEKLNIAYTNVADLSPLDGLNINLLAAQHTDLTAEEKERFAELKPDCQTTYKNNPYGPGWRYDDNNDPLEWYTDIQDAFGYPKPLNNTGWYLD